MKKIALLFLLIANNSFAQSNVTYQVPLGENQPSTIDRCNVEVVVGQLGSFDAIARAPEYVMSFTLTPAQNANHIVKIKGSKKWGIPPNNAPACDFDREFYINRIIMDEWALFRNRLNNDKANECINIGVKSIGRSISGDVTKETLFLKVDDPKSNAIFSACDKILSMQLDTGISCKLGNNLGDSTCDEGYFSERLGSNKRLTYQQAIANAVQGDVISKGMWENKEAEKNRIEKAEKVTRAAEEQAAEAEKRRIWLETPEGKKYLAEEAAKAKKEEQERARAEAAEKVRLAQEFPNYALITCSFSGRHTNIYSCFGGNVDTEIELTNGSQYGLYKLYQFNSIGKETGKGFVINLRSNFKLKVQNSGDSLVLGVKIINRRNDGVLFEKQVSRFGVISVKN